MPVPVVSRMLDIPTTDGVADAYLAHPAQGPARASVLMFMDVFGLRPAFTAMADRLAGEGYLVLAPNLFYRRARSPLTELGDLLEPTQRARVLEVVLPYLRELEPDSVLRDTAAFLQFLDGCDVATGGQLPNAGRPPTPDPHGDASGGPAPIGMVGYCMGGMFGLHVAGRFGPRIAALASFHGGDLATEKPTSPHLGAAGICAELYFAHADNDPSAPPEQIARLEAALDAARVNYRSEVYPGCAHGFTQSDSPVHDPAATVRHWQEMLALFAHRLPS